MKTKVKRKSSPKEQDDASPEQIAAKLYERYAYLAVVYSKKINNYQSLGLTQEDIIQDLRVKIFTCILSYGRRYADYMETGKYKPVPLKNYILSGLVNLLRDKFTYLDRRKEECHAFSIQSDKVDVGEYIGEENIFNEGFVLRGIDLCMGLNGVNKLIFSMYLRGHTPLTIRRKIPDLSFKPDQIKQIISKQIEVLQPYRGELVSEVRRYSVKSFNQD